MIWLVLTAALTAAGIGVGWMLRGKRITPAAKPVTSNPGPTQLDERASLRASALDSLAEAVLVTDGEGRVRDCNSSALTLFNRHRGEVEDQYATALLLFY